MVGVEKQRDLERESEDDAAALNSMALKREREM